MEGGIDLPVGEVSSAGVIDCPTDLPIFTIYFIILYFF